MEIPTLLILGGCNGAGKSTSATELVSPGIPFLNADEIAKVLPDEQGKHVQAGRQLLEQWEQMIAVRTDFAIETTLANRTLAGRIREIQAMGYSVRLFFLWLPDVNLAVRRVAERVQNGGHDIPEEVIRRRHDKGWQNFLQIYRSSVDEWRVYNNEVRGRPVLVASCKNQQIQIADVNQWEIFEAYSNE